MIASQTDTGYFSLTKKRIGTLTHMADTTVTVGQTEQHEMDTANAMTTTSPLVGLVSGCAGAVALVYVGQPLDTVKVRMQLSTASHVVTSRNSGVSMWGCVRDMWHQALVTPTLQQQRLNNIAVVGENGVVGSGRVIKACPLTSTTTNIKANRAAAAGRMARLMYAGTAPALLANVAENGVLFAAYGPCQRLVAFVLDLFSVTGSTAVDDVEKKLGPAGMATAGSLASLCSAFALCPTELIKVRLQAADLERSKTISLGTSAKRPVSASSTLQVVAHVWKTEGGLRGMYRGLGSTVVREMPGYYVFFLAYEASRNFLNEWHHRGGVTSTMTTKSVGGGGGHGAATTNRDEPTWITMAAGAAAGTCLWLVVYPVDAIKSRIQASGGSGTENSSGSFLKTLILSVRNEGPLALYRGLAPTLIRTVPASAVMFWTVERTTTLLSGYGL